MSVKNTTATKSSPLSILEALKDERLGYKFGKPQRLGENALSVILPILRETSAKRQYITYPETDKVSVVDSGSINRMTAASVSSETVFIRSGTIFKGGTQERATVRSAIVFPGAILDMEVRCVHASKGIRAGTKVTYGGVTPSSFDSANYTAGFTAKDQSATWRNVSAFSQSLNKSAEAPKSVRPTASSGIRGSRSVRRNFVNPDSISPIRSHGLFSNEANANATHYNGMQSSDFTSSAGLDDLHSAQLDFAKNFDDILSKITPVENQAGLALINHDGCQTIETFDVPLSWAALHTDAVKRVGSHETNQDDCVFEYKPENAVKAVQKVLAEDYTPNLIYEHKPSNGEPYVAIHGLTSKNFVGEVVELDNRVIHLLLVRQV
jgi:ARG/rhodanese/phosphatase superfamily protein